MLSFIIKVIIAICGVIGAAAVTFIAVRLQNWMDSHDIFKDDANLAMTVTIPNQIKTLSDDVAKTHEEAINTFSSEFHPLKQAIKRHGEDIHKLKKHTKFKDNGKSF